MIKEIKVSDYESFCTLYVNGSREDVAKIAAFVTELHNENLQPKTKKDETDSGATISN